MKLTVDDYKFVEKILSLPKKNINKCDFPELKDSQFSYKIKKINYLLKLLKKECFYKRNNNYYLNNKNTTLEYLITNFDFVHHSKKQRKQILLEKFLIENYVKINEIMSFFSKSRTAIKNDFLELEEDLQYYNLSLEYRHSYGYFLSGNEYQIRRYLLKNYIEMKDTSKICEKVKNIVFEYLKGKNSSYETAKILEIVIYIQYHRLKNKNYIEEGTVKKEISKYDNQEIESFLQCPKRVELDYFIYFLEGLCYYENNLEMYHTEFPKLFEKFIEEINKFYGEDIYQDKYLKEHLQMHMKTAIFKLMNGIPILNPVMEEDMSSLKDLIKLIKLKVKPFEKYFQIKFNIDEIIFIVFHIKAAHIRLNRKRNVLIVCNLGPGASSILENELNKNFVINIVDNISYHQFKVKKYENIDIIIHTIDEFQSEIESYKVNPLLTYLDKTRLENMGLVLK